VRDIEDAFRDESGRLRLSRTAVSELGEQLWADYQEFATRDLSEYEIVYLFVDGIAERIRPGQRREPVIGGLGLHDDGRSGAPAPGGRLQGGCLARGVVADYGRDLPSAVAGFEDAFEACIAHLRMPVTHRRAIRTTNLLERLFLEERRRLKIIPNAFGERPVLKLMFGAMTRAADRWRAIKFPDFERRQIAAIRQELDHEY
jgi:transposase-like protein